MSVCVCLFSHIWLFVTPWTIACQDPLSMEFSRQEYWSGLPLSSPGDLPDTGIIPVSFASPTLSGRFFITMPPVKPIVSHTHQKHILKKKLIRFFFLKIAIQLPTANVEEEGVVGWIPESGRSSGVGNGNLLQCSCLGNPMDRGAWWGHKESNTTEQLNMHAQPKAKFLNVLYIDNVNI